MKGADIPEPPEATGSHQAVSTGTAPETDEARGSRDAERSFTFPAVARLELDDLLVQLIERAQEVLRTQGRLRGLVRATQAISADLDLPTLLSRIVDQARVLIGAKYAALGVIGEDEHLAEFVHAGMDAATVTKIGHLPTGRGLLGQLVSDPRPLRLPDLSAHASSVGFPAHHPPMASFLGVPVRIRGQVFGNLYLTEKLDGAEFTAEDKELALSLASAAAAAIDNAHLFETVGRREHWLDASRAVSNDLMHVSDRDEALSVLAAAVRAVSAADLAAVVVQQPAGELTIAAIDGYGADVVLGAVIPPDAPAALALRLRESVLIDDVTTHPEVHGPITDLGVGPLAAVPLAAQDQALGALVVANLPGHREFSKLDLDMLGDFATQAALVLLVAHAQQAAKELEMGEERARIARDLHDHAIQGIFSVGLGLNSVAVRVGGAEGSQIAEYIDQLDDAIKAIRRSIFALQRPASPGGQASFRASLIQMTDEASRALGFSPVLHTEGPMDSIVPDEIAHDALAVVREALSNVNRHAKANRVDVRVRASSDLTIEVQDDGVGIGDVARSSGLGNMRERARRHGGQCTVTAPDIGGTQVRWVVPLVS